MGQKIIVIVGPTCSSKTFLGIELASQINGEIISADSRQVYKHLNIGTAKPTQEELEKAKHHFINVLELDEEFDASSFSILAEKTIGNLIKENKTPIVVGGSGLYIKALIDGIVESANKDDSIREKLLSEKEKYGNNYLYEKLLKADPKSAETLLPQNWKRVIRALEVIELTGKPIWQHHQNQKNKSEFQFVQIGLKWPRDILYENINNRVEKMIDYGLVEEVDSILKAGYDTNLNSLNTVGYKEIISHLDCEITLERAIELIKRNTRHYAKRQLTWFNADERIKWYDVSSQQELIDLVPQVISH